MRKFLLFLVMIISSYSVTQAQSRKRSNVPAGKPKTNQQDAFLKKQLWLGFKAGANFSAADPIRRYTVLTPTNYSPALADKKYTGFSGAGSQATLEITFQYKNFYVSTQPTYRQSRFDYSNQYQWKNLNDPNESLVQNYHNEQKVNYFDVPLILRYGISAGKFRPYIQAGIYYAFLINATQTVNISGTDVASGGTNQFSSEPVIVGAKDQFANYWGLMFGAGVTYQLGNVQLVLDAAYRKGMSNITNTKNRFNNDRLSGIGDVPDDVKLNNIVISAGILFPMRFLNSNFKSFER